MKISYLEPERQKEAALLLAAGEIRTVDEYTAKENPEEKSRNRKIQPV